MARALPWCTANQQNHRILFFIAMDIIRERNLSDSSMSHKNTGFLSLFTTFGCKRNSDLVRQGKGFWETVCLTMWEGENKEMVVSAPCIFCFHNHGIPQRILGAVGFWGCWGLIGDPPIELQFTAPLTSCSSQNSLIVEVSFNAWCGCDKLY